MGPRLRHPTVDRFATKVAGCPCLRIGSAFENGANVFGPLHRSAGAKLHRLGEPAILDALPPSGRRYGDRAYGGQDGLEPDVTGRGKGVGYGSLPRCVVDRCSISTSDWCSGRTMAEKLAEQQVIGSSTKF